MSSEMVGKDATSWANVKLSDTETLTGPTSLKFSMP